MKVSKKIVTLSKKDADKYLAYNNFVGQRTLSDGHVDDLKSKVDRGLFHTGSVALVHTPKETLLADGQHQLTMCSRYDVSIDVVLQEYHLNGEVDDPEAMARIFSQYNVDRSRTRGEIAWIFGCQLGWESWTRKVVTVLSSALSALESGSFLQASRLAKDDAAALMACNTKVCEWVHGMGIAGHRHLKRTATVAAMIATWRKSQKGASEFWAAVRDGEGLKKTDPRYVLREYLKDASLQGGVKNPAQKQLSDGRAMYAKCIHAWNAWRDDRGTSLKYFPNSPLPKPQ